MENATLTLTDFLLARIAEDEGVARAVIIPAFDGHRPHPELSKWQYAPYGRDCSGEVEYVQTAEMLAHKYPDRLYVTCDGEGLSPAVSEEVGTHIARHDPARVLAECAAKRLVLTIHEDYMSDLRAYRSPSWQDVEDDTNRIDRLKAEARGRVSSDAVQALAQVYADHPEFRDEWRWENR